MKPVRIAPSLLAADFRNLEKAVTDVDAYGDWYPLDVRDVHFVPNLSLGPYIVEAVRAITSKPLDVHLMVEHPQRFFKSFADAGASSLTFHSETGTFARWTEEIRGYGCQAGVAYNPRAAHVTDGDVLGTLCPDPLPLIDPFLDTDLYLVMGVHPGFYGQPFQPQTLKVVEKLSRDLFCTHQTTLISVDGGVAATHIPSLVRYGADVLVVGSAIFKQEDPSAAIRNLRKLVDEAQASMSESQ